MTVYNESSHKFQMRMRIQYRISKDVAEITRIFYDVTMMVPSDSDDEIKTIDLPELLLQSPIHPMVCFCKVNAHLSVLSMVGCT